MIKIAYKKRILISTEESLKYQMNGYKLGQIFYQNHRSKRYAYLNNEKAIKIRKWNYVKRASSARRKDKRFRKNGRITFKKINQKNYRK